LGGGKRPFMSRAKGGVDERTRTGKEITENKGGKRVPKKTVGNRTGQS